MKTIPRSSCRRPGFSVYSPIRFSAILLAAAVITAVINLSDFVSAQSPTRIIGTVRDGVSGKPLAGAHIQAAGTAFGAVTDNSGTYRMDYLPLGTYTLQASFIGYRAETRNSITVEEDIIVRCDFLLIPQPFETEEITVTAEGYRLRSVPAGVSTQTVSRTDILKSNAANAAEVLTTVPGVQVLDSGGAGAPKRISLRGGASNQVLILLDGKRIDSGQNDTIDLSTIPSSIVENIEIIRGNLSSVYGPNAVNGVINIVTRNSQSTTPIALRTTVGSFGERIIGTNLSGSLKSVQSIVTLEHGEYNGDFEFTDPHGVTRNRENSSRKYRSAFTKLNRSSKKSRISLQGYYYEADRRLPGIIFQETPDAESDYSKGIISLSGNYAPTDRQILELSLSHNNNSTRNFNPTGFQFDTDSRNISNMAELSFQVKLSNYTRLSGGTSFRNDRLEHQNHGLANPFDDDSYFSGVRKQEMKSVFASAGQEASLPIIFDRLDFTLSARLDDHSQSGSQLSPHAGLVFSRSTFPEIKIRASYGRSYRPPNFDDLYYEGFRAKGNPELLPERSRGGDAGIEITFKVFGKLRLDHSYFHTIVEDIILWRQRFDGVFTPFNIARSKTFGSESLIEWQSENEIFSVAAHHTYIRALNQSGERTTHNMQLPHRPVHSTFIQTAINIEPISAGIKSRSVSRRFIREANTKPMPAYTVMDIFSTYRTQFSNWPVTAGLSIDNLFNEEYMVLERMPIPGRTFRFQLTLNYNRTENN